MMHPSSATLPGQGKRPVILAGIVFAFLLFFCVSLFLTPLLSPAHLSDHVLLYLSRLCFWACTFIVYVYAVKAEKLPFLFWDEKKLAVPKYLLSVISILLILLAGMALIAVVVKPLGINNKSAKLQEMVSVLRKDKWLLLFTCLTAAVTEELVFRGYLIPRLQLFFKNPYPSLLISTALFGIAHISYGSVVQVVGPLYIGLIFALYYQKYRNIKVVMACHFLWDLLTLLIMTH
jgi:uncharacterized protein